MNINKLAFCAYTAYTKVQRFKNDIKGMGTVEVVLIVAVLVALALLFKEFITKYANDLFDSISEKTANAFSSM